MNPKENPLMYFFYITKTIERTLATRVFDECGITHADAKLIIMIGTCPAVTQAALAELLEVSPPAVSRKIERLVKKGYVLRKTNPENRRSQEINLTSEGRKLFKKTHVYLEKTLSELLESLGGIDKKAQQELERITTHFKGDMSEQELCVQKAFEKNYK